MPPRLPPRPILAAIAVAAVLGGAGVYALVSANPAEPVARSTPSPSATSTPRPTPTRTPRPSPSPSPTPIAAPTCPVNGLALDAALAPDRVGLIVQFDNDPHARPQTGMSDADLLIEATVQGNVTRFAALYYCTDPATTVGPVRSARFFNLDLWQQMHALTVGFGGAPYSIQHFINGGMPYLNGNDGWGYFARSSARIAPYNVYVDLGAIRTDLTGGRLEQFKVGIEEVRPPFEVSETAEVRADRTVSGVTIETVSFWRYSFSYDPERQGFTRADFGQTMVDANTSEPVTVRTVVVQRVTQEVIYGIDFGAGGNPIMHVLVGEGAGTVYIDGSATEVRWSRPDAGSVTTWTYADTGEPLVLPPGKIWWQIIPTTASVTER